MERQLYGREAIFGRQGLAARLTGLAPAGFAKVAYEHGDDPPVVVLTGGRGMGKTAVLKQLRHVYRPGTPVALLDCATVEPPADHGPGWTPVTGALIELATQLAPKVAAGKAVQFPRLALGLVAVASTGWTSDDDEQARRDLLRLGPVLATVNEKKGAAPGWVSELLTTLAGLVLEGAAPVVGIVAEKTVETVVSELFGWAQKRTTAWYGSYPNAGDSGTRGLRLLAVDFERDGELRARAESHLVSALIADLSYAYRGLSGSGARRGRPLILLDNAHLPLGRALVEPVLRRRSGSGHRDQVVVFATSRMREHEGLRHAVRRRLPEVAHTAPCPRGADVTSGILAVELTPLSPAHVRTAFDRYDPSRRTPPGLARGVHRLTGGRPLGAVLLAQAAGEAGEPASLVPGALFDHTVELREDQPPVPVATELLDRLLPPELRRDTLAVLAAAHGEDSARLLARTRLRGESYDGDVALRVRDLLLAEDWPVGPGHFIADPLLRALLLHRLRFNDGDHPSYAAWRAVHETLHSTYGEQHPSFRLHQELVLGRAEDCVTHLRATFPGPGVLGWLGELRFIASAPYARERPAAGPDPRRAAALGQETAPPALPSGLGHDDAELHLRLRRLLHAVWLLSDPLVLPDDEVIDKMAYELRQLSGQHLTGNSVLWDAATHWPQDIRAWRAPSMPPGRAEGDSGA
ncbi:MAG TPA: hypothetical protein VFH94_03030 [Streptomyces sp.]|nr:hypothetical protein [Streptomyces sp.]